MFENSMGTMHRMRGMVVIAVILGAARTWLTRTWMFPDGMSYADLGAAWLRGDWWGAVNGHWSPMYSWLIGIAIAVFRPGPQLEVPLIHAVNFGIYLAALASFAYLLQQALRTLPSDGAEHGDPRIAMPAEALVAFGYSVFIWSALCLISLGNTTPDMAVAAFLYLAAAIVLRIRHGDSGIVVFALLGATLGLGYLAKSVMLPIAVIFAGVAALAYGRMRGLLPRAIAFAVGLALFAGPYIGALSYKLGRFSYGESGTHAVAWFINDVHHTAHWQGGPKGCGTPLHTTRIIHEDPPVYEFAEPIGGTYPPWYDPTYWYDGVQPHIDLRKQVSHSIGLLRRLAQLIVYEHSFGFGAIAVVYLFAVILARSERTTGWSSIGRDLVLQYPLLVPTAAGLAMYLMVWIKPRYIAGFVTLLALALLLAAPVSAARRSTMVSLCRALGLVLLCVTALSLVRQQPDITDTSEDAIVAEQLSRMGVEPGARVAHIGNSFRAYWAHLAGVKIVTEIRPEDVVRYGEAGPRQAAIHEAFRAAGADILITERSAAGGTDWEEIAGTGYSLLRLDEHAAD